MSAPALEEEEYDQKEPKMPEEALMAARTLEKRELTGRNGPHEQRDKNADEELWRRHRNVEQRITDRDAEKHGERECKKYTPHA